MQDTDVTKKMTLSLGLLIAAAWLGLVQLAFYWIQKDAAEQSLKAFTSLVRSELIQSNFDYLSRSLMDLRRQGAMDCVSLAMQSPTPLQIVRLESPICERRAVAWWLGGEDVTVDVAAESGAVFRVIFRSLNSAYFYWGLWSARCGGLVLLGLVYWIFRERARVSMRLAQVEREHAQMLFETAAKLAHDIRSPLSALLTVAATLPTQMTKQKEMLEKASTRIRDVASDLLSEYRESQSDAVLFDSVTALCEVRELHPRALDIEVANRVEELFPIRAPRSQFLRIISNLINNAFEAEEKNRVKLSVSEGNDHTIVIVRDHGRGFSSEVLGELQKQIFGISTKTGRRDAGFGLGLKGTASLMRSMGGKAQFMNGYDGGAIVALYFPKT